MLEGNQVCLGQLGEAEEGEGLPQDPLGETGRGEEGAERADKDAEREAQAV